MLPCLLYTSAAVSCESQHIYTTGGLTVNDDQKEVQVDGETLRLTPIEYNILLLLIKNQDVYKRQLLDWQAASADDYVI